MIWFGWVSWHINHCRLLNDEFSLYIYMKYVWFGLVWFGSISTVVVYLILNPHYSYKYIWFGLAGFYDKSTIVGYLMSNPVNSHILNICD